jgi:hypothetical protein
LEEKLHCNICDTNIDATNMAEEHWSTPLHAFRKSNFEKILEIIRTSKLHSYRDSVISYWKKSNGI